MSQTNPRTLRKGRSFSVPNDENKPFFSKTLSSRKRKAVSKALGDISNSQEVPNKIARTESSDHGFLQKTESFVIDEAMDEDESGIEASSELAEIGDLQTANTLKLLLDENHQVIGTVEEIQVKSSDVDSSAECLEMTCAEEDNGSGEISFNEVISSSQISTHSQGSAEEDNGSFNPIADHIIMKVMDYLPVTSLLDLSLISKRFNTILNDNPNRFPLTLCLDFDGVDEDENHDEDEDEFPEVFVRCYRVVKVVHLTTPTSEDRIEKFINLFKSFGAHIHDIHFTDCDLTFEFFSRLITIMPNIVSLQLEETDLNPGANDVEWPALTSLKKVNVCESNIENIAKVLQHVTTLEEVVFSIPNKPIHDNSDDDVDVDYNLTQQEEDNELPVFVEYATILGTQFNAIKAVLARQVNLKAMEIIRGSFFASPFVLNGVQLKKLVLFIPWCSAAELTNMKEFVKSQTQLNSVVFNVLCAQSNDFSVCFDHLAKLPSLKDLRIVFYDGPQMTEDYHNYTFTNASVKDIYLGLRGIRPDCKAILTTTNRLFPNTEEIHLTMTYNIRTLLDVFAPLAEYKRLQSLTVDRVLTPSLRHLRNSTMKNFTASSILLSINDDWNVFFRNNPAIEKLRLQCHLQEEFPLPEFLELAVASLPKIKQIRICTRESLARQDDERIKRLFETSSSLKSITLCRFNLYKFEENRVILRKNDGTILPFPRENDDDDDDDDDE